MAKVPVYAGPQARSEALQGGFRQAPQSADAFGAIAGRQMSALGNAVGDAAEATARIVDRKDADDALRAETAIKDEWRKYNSELRKRRGKNAEGLLADAEKWWGEARERVGAGLSERGKKLIGRSLERARIGELDQVGAFQDRELETAFIESTNADTAVEIDRYATNADPKAVGSVREVITRNVDLMAGRLGWDAPRREQELKRFTNIAHRQMVDRLMDVDPMQAKAYVDANRDEIAGSALTVIDREVSKAVSETEGARFADSVAALPFEQQLAKAAEIKDPEASKAARTRIRQNQQDIQIVQAQRERAASDEVWQLVANGTPERGLPRAALARMDGKDRMQVAEHYRAQREKALKDAKEGGVKTDWNLYAELRSLPPEEFKALRLSGYVDRIGGPQMEQLLDQQTRLKQPDKEVRAATRTQVLNAFVDENELKNERKGQFQGAFYQAVDDFTAANKREPTPEEERKLMNDLMRDVVTHKGILWDSKSPAYTLPPGQRAGDTGAAPAAAAPAAAPAAPPVQRPKTYVAVPMDARKEITAVLRSRGRPVTEENIQLLYQSANPPTAR
jgi:hypothetical protein